MAVSRKTRRDVKEIRDELHKTLRILSALTTHVPRHDKNLRYNEAVKNPWAPCSAYIGHEVLENFISFVQQKLEERE